MTESERERVASAEQAVDLDADQRAFDDGELAGVVDPCGAGGLVRGLFRLIDSLHPDAAGALRLSPCGRADRQRDPGTAAVLLLVFVLLAGVNSPLVFPRSIGALEAQHRSAVDGRPVVFWRPGCKYCIRPRIRLGRRAGQVHWVDIWRDPVAGAAVRAANDGASERDAVLAQPPSGARAD